MGATNSSSVTTTNMDHYFFLKGTSGHLNLINNDSVLVTTDAVISYYPISREDVILNGLLNIVIVNNGKYRLRIGCNSVPTTVSYRPPYIETLYSIITKGWPLYRIVLILNGKKVVAQNKIEMLHMVKVRTIEFVVKEEAWEIKNIELMVEDEDDNNNLRPILSCIKK